jgi:tRNA G37 N-methylase Trm5
MNLKELLKDKLSKDELENLKSSFDMIGDIAVIEIDDTLKHKEKIIADTLLQMVKNIKVVCKKVGRHKGEFRIQSMKVIAGEERKETITKENGISLKLDVEKVYFSPRMSTERKRISEMIRPGEDILCMFSGCGPYPLTFLRKQPNLWIDSIEINPIGAEYQRQNLSINRSISRKIEPVQAKSRQKQYLDYVIEKRINVLNGDVKEIVPNIKRGKIGIKSSIKIKEIETRLVKDPAFIELHLMEGDLEKGMDNLRKSLAILEEISMDVILHIPEDKVFMDYYNLMVDDKDKISLFFMVLSKIQELYNEFYNIIGIVVHPNHYKNKEGNVDFLINNLQKIKEMYPKLSDLLYFENLPLCFYSDKELIKFAQAGGNICFDINHYYGVYKDNVKLLNLLHELKEIYDAQGKKMYFHIADSSGNLFGKPHSLELGKGEVDFEHVFGLIEFGTIEVECKDYLEPLEMLRSYDLFEKILPIKKYDRITMPLPKSAEDFLDTALIASKKGTIIHFYDFLNEDEFYQARDKIAAACNRAGKEFRILRITKCGQHAPRVYRICVDFEVLS